MQASSKVICQDSEMKNIDLETSEKRGKKLLKEILLHINSLCRDNMYM